MRLLTFSHTHVSLTQPHSLEYTAILWSGSVPTLPSAVFILTWHRLHTTRWCHILQKLVYMECHRCLIMCWICHFKLDMSQVDLLKLKPICALNYLLLVRIKFLFLFFFLLCLFAYVSALSNDRQNCVIETQEDIHYYMKIICITRWHYEERVG